MTEYDYKKVEQKWQEKWAKAKAFEANVDPDKKKFTVSFPIAYLNGSIHVGHAYTLM
ncbi:MAG: class I tRNA ligase family protein, partial [Candidatus Heimdallarchaeota archaeon]